MARSETRVLTGRALVGALATSLALLVAVALAGLVPDASAAATALKGKVWTATYVRGIGEVPPSASFTSTAEFGSRTVRGRGAVNSYRARYIARGDGTMRIFDPVSTLTAGTPEADAQESAFFKALSRSATFRISGDVLKLRGRHGGLVIAFVASPAGLLAGTSWKAVEVTGAEGGLNPLIAGSEITAVFGTDGRLGGRASINHYGTTYEERDGGALTIDPRIISTLIAGPEELMAQEQAYLAALPRVTAYEIAGDGLLLRDARGAPLAHFAVGQ